MNLEKSGQLSGTLAAYEEQYRILFDHNPNPMWVYDLETLRFLAVNDAAVYHYGYSRDEFFGMTIRDIRPPEDLARLDENLRLAVVHSDPRMIGYAFELQKRYAYMPGAKSRLTGVLKSGRTEMINDIPDEMLVARAKDEDDLRIFRMLGPGAVMIVPLLAFERTLGAITLVHAESKRKFTEEDRLLAEDLARRAAMQIELARLYRETKELNASIEKTVDERTLELQAANRELEAFSYSVSHGLRAPLRHIHGFSDLLARHTGISLDEKGKRYLGYISNSVKEMGVLIDDLVMFSRRGRVEMRKSSVDLRDTVESVINSMSQETGGRDIKWKIYWLPVVEANQNMLRLEFQNILGNAVKYTRPMERAVIEIGGRLNDGEAVISVRDNGVGFDMKYSDNLFGVFQRVHSSEIFEGSGIGLANVRRIIHRHGGRTWAEGEVDRGAAIYSSLPASKKG